jgi:hypothetical protein
MSMNKNWLPLYMTAEEESCFGKDGKLKIIKQWIHNGKSYSARRDTKGYIGIVDDETYFGVGNAGVDYCFREEDICALASRLGVL